MKIIIAEDEKHARDYLENMLRSIDPSIEVLGRFDRVQETVAWLRENQADLLFLDIHLADDLSFRIFEQLAVRTPVIFTTAYDQYALRAFKVNSIDYLLKPIRKEELASALEKFRQTRISPFSLDVEQLVKMIQTPSKTFQQRFLVSRKNRIMSVPVEEIAYFEGEDRYVYLFKKDGSRYIIEYKLSELETMLDPHHFFRLNRSFVARFEAIENIMSLSKSRVMVSLNPSSKREIIVSSANTAAFKNWLNR